MKNYILKKNYKKRNIIKLIFIVFIIYCTKEKKENETINNKIISKKNTSLKSTLKQKKEIAGTTTLKNNNNNIKNFNNSQGKKKVLVIMLHGLIAKKDIRYSKKNFTKIRKILRETYYNKNLKQLFIEIGDTVDMHIYDQAKTVYKKIRNYYKKNKIKPKTRVIFIGHSAGGLVSYELYKKYNKKLNIKGIVTISCPWKGTNLANNHKEMKLPLKILLGEFNKTYDNKKCGIRDVSPNSKFLKWVKTTIKNCKIPIWAIGGNTNYYSKIFSIKFLKFLCFKERCTEKSFFGADKHDGVVPLDSQLGKGLENIKSIEIKKERVNHSLDIKTELSKYSTKAINLLGNLFPYQMKKKLKAITYEKAITESDIVINNILKFINKYGFGEIKTKTDVKKISA